MTNQATKTAPTAATPRTAQNYFSRKIGNTTFVVSVSFSEKTKESIDDKILRLIASQVAWASSSRSERPAEIQKGEAVQCG